MARILPTRSLTISTTTPTRSEAAPPHRLPRRICDPGAVTTRHRRIRPGLGLARAVPTLEPTRPHGQSPGRANGEGGSNLWRDGGHDHDPALAIHSQVSLKGGV